MDFLLYFGNADQVKVELSSGDSEAVAQVDYLSRERWLVNG